MTTLYVQEQGAIVRKRDLQCLVTKERELLEELPLAKLEQLVLLGMGVQITTSMLVYTQSHGIPVLIMNKEGSKVLAWLTNGVSPAGGLRTQQMYFVNAPERALELARAIIAAKLINQRALLAATSWSAARSAVAVIERQRASLQGAASIDLVRGYEGAAAAAYFGAWKTALPKAWGFGGRAFHPPPDPVNALLSFGYTLALNDVLTAVKITGMDPYLGTFHVIEAGRPSLALDLLEEFRPLVVDRMALELLGGKVIARTHFERPAQLPDAVYLNDEGRALVIDHYEAAMQQPARLASGEETTMRRAVLLQAQAVVRVIRGEQERYVGYTPQG